MTLQEAIKVLMFEMDSLVEIDDTCCEEMIQAIKTVAGDYYSRVKSGELKED